MTGAIENTMIPFQPKSLEEHERRYANSVATVSDADTLLCSRMSRPDILIDQVFDCNDGMRLLINRKRLQQGTLVMHVSAMVERGSELWGHAQRGEISIEQFLRLSEGRFARISGEKRPLPFLGRAGLDGVPHWLLEVEDKALNRSGTASRHARCQV